MFQEEENAHQKAWMARWIKNNTCKNEGCNNARQPGSSRCKECSNKNLSPGFDRDFSIL
jgi:hypothetical protein